MALKRVLSLLTAFALLASPMQGFTQETIATTQSTTQQNLQNISGYKLLKTTYSKTYDANIYQYEHVKSGGKVVYIATNDSHKVMDVIVKTPAADQTGANHVLEHALLSGSDKYPTKAPFNTVAATSVNTFANAMTYNDRTVFTFSTDNDKDFDNLKRVYLDGIFAPSLLKDDRIFMREGWRYQLDEQGKLGYTGVVYSEMMGLYANPGVVHQQGVYEALYPNTTYANDAGGVPEKIVNLSAQQLRKVYNTYYQPSNMLVYYYGNVNLPNELKYLDQNYWSKFSKQAVPLSYGSAKSVGKDVTFKNQYHVDQAEDTRNNSIVSLNYMLPANMSKKDQIAMNYLMYFLTRAHNAPLYSDFIETGLGSQFEGYSDTANKYPMVSFSMTNTNASSAENFKAFLDSTLAYYANNGIDPKLIANTESSMVLNNKLGLLSANKGNNLRDDIELGYSTFNDPLYFIDNDNLETQILKEAIDSDYFQKLIKTYLVDYSKRALVITEPKEGLNAIKDSTLSRQLNDRYTAMSEAEKAKLKTTMSSFKQWNEAQDTPESLAKLPTLKLTDINYDLKDEEKTEEAIGTAKLYTYARKVDGLTDLTFYFDLSNLTDQDRLDLMMLQGYFLNMPTRNKSAQSLVDTIDKTTTGLTTDILMFTDDNNYDLSTNRFYVNATFQNDDTPLVLDVFQEIFNNQRFDSKAFAKYIADEMTNRLSYAISTDLDAVAYGNMSKYLTPSGVTYANTMSNEAAYAYFKNLSQNMDQEYPKLLKRLIAVYDRVFCRDNLVVSIATDPSQVESSQRQVKALISKLKYYNIDTTVLPKSDQMALLQKGSVSEGIIAPTQVSYIYKGFNLNSIGETFKGSYLVFAQLLNNQYAYQELREKNGAYGGYFSATSNGNMYFSSYRDPGILPSLQSMDSAGDWLKNLKLTQSDLDPIIVSIVGQLNQPSNVLVQVDTDLQDSIAGKTTAQKEKIIEEVLKTTPKDLEDFIALLEKGMSQSKTIVVGPEKQIQEQASIFETIRILLK